MCLGNRVGWGGGGGVGTLHCLWNLNLCLTPVSCYLQQSAFCMAQSSQQQGRGHQLLALVLHVMVQGSVAVCAASSKTGPLFATFS
jgi:hypothetical protein